MRKEGLERLKLALKPDEARPSPLPPLPTPLARASARHKNPFPFPSRTRTPQAFGSIVVLEGVLLDTRSLQGTMWRTLADEAGLRMPATPRPIHNVRPERVISEVFMWTRDWKEVRVLLRF